MSKQENWIYTVAAIGVEPHTPHIMCPECHKCMGCYN